MGWLSDLLTKYWYVVAILLLILLYYIWKSLDIYTRVALKKFFSGRTLFIIVFFGWWYIWHKYLSAQEVVSTANRWMPVLAFAILTGMYYIGKLRYETQQVVTPNFHGSFNKPPYKVDGFYIFAIDTFNAGGLSWDYAQRVLVVREETAEMMHDGAVSIASVTLADPQYELPENVYTFIKGNKFLKGAKEIYYGWFDDLERIDWKFKQLGELEKTKRDPNSIYSLIKKELAVDNPKISTLYWSYKNQSKAVNKQTEWYDATIDSVEKGVEHRKRVKDSYSPDREEKKSVEGHEENY